MKKKKKHKKHTAYTHDTYHKVSPREEKNHEIIIKMPTCCVTTEDPAIETGIPGDVPEIHTQDI